MLHAQLDVAGESPASTSVAPKGNVLILAYWYPPDNESGAQRPARFTRYLPRQGYQPYVVTASSPREATGDATISRVPDPRNVRFGTRVAQLGGQILQRCLPYNERLEWLPHALARSRHILEQNQIQAVISTAPPTSVHLAALILKRRFGVKWIADFRDPLTGNPFRNRRGARWYDEGLERLIFRNADAIIAVTDSIAEEWKQKYPRWASKIHVIWNGYDPDSDLGPQPVPQRKRKVISHVGAIYGGRHPKVLLCSLLRLVERGALDPSTFLLRLVGTIDKDLLPIYESPMRELTSRGCVELLNRLIPRAQALDLTAQSDGLLLLDGNDLNKGYTVPAKLYEYAQVGRPILAQTARRSPVDRILGASGLQHVCIYHDQSEQEVDRRVLEFLQLPNQSSPPNSWFLKTFDGELQTEALSEILGAL